MITIVSIIQTCPACPSQWEGHLDDGRMFYIRYRWGHGEIRVSPKATKDVGDAVMGEVIYSWSGDDGLDGMCSIQDIYKRFPDIKWLCTPKDDLLDELTD